MASPATRRLIRCALVQAPTAFPMPRRRSELSSLAGRLAELRRQSLERHVLLLETAARLGARLAALGELFATPFFPVDPDPLWWTLAEDALEGPTVRAMRLAARKLGLVIVAPIFEADKLSAKRFNTAVVVDAGGEVLGCYRKLHLASGDPSALAEAFHYEAGDGRQRPKTGAEVSRNPYFPVFQTSAGRLGVALGADRRLPGTLESLAREDAEIALCLQSACEAEVRRLWDAESLVDSARHRLFIGAGNRVGREEPWGREYFGGSAWYGPLGKLEDESPAPELAIADLDLGLLAETPLDPLRPARDARPEAYSPRKIPRSRR